MGCGDGRDRSNCGGGGGRDGGRAAAGGGGRCLATAQLTTRILRYFGANKELLVECVSEKG